MAKKKLPVGYYIDPSHCYAGTGNGDEQFAPMLYQWGTQTVGHLWWKREVTGWSSLRLFDRRSSIAEVIDFAWILEGVK